jgi:hypothetical protein
LLFADIIKRLAKPQQVLFARFQLIGICFLPRPGTVRCAGELSLTAGASIARSIISAQLTSKPKTIN